MNSLERVLTTLAHREPDRVPFFLLPTMHGARELGMTLREYFSKAENVFEGQIRIAEKYGSDCASGFFHAALEIEAWGGEVLFYDDGPPNSGDPPIRDVERIATIEPPRVADSPSLREPLRLLAMLRERFGAEKIVVGVVLSPFSFPVMQLGFDRTIELIYERRDLFDRLMAVNEEFCVEWANAQFEAGASAVAYFDPLVSPTCLPPEITAQTGFPVAQRTISRMHGPAVSYLASGRTLGVLDRIAETGAMGVTASCLEDLAEVKRRCRGRLTVVGNLDGVSMRTWTPEETEAQVKTAIAQAGPGGGFILSDNHGEIPFQVPDETLLAVRRAVEKWGRYPLSWTERTDGE